MSTEKLLPPAAFLTKEQLKAEAIPRDKAHRNSTDDETPLGTALPEDTGTESETPYELQEKTTKKYTKTKE